jgi:hypothetical protein
MPPTHHRISQLVTASVPLPTVKDILKHRDFQATVKDAIPLQVIFNLKTAIEKASLAH